MSSAPRVTVCVPTIGRIEYLEETIRSIAAQTFTNFEVLVLDNGSAPASAARVQELARCDPRIRVLRQSERIPMFANFNRGVMAAAGDIIAFCHDDDRLLPSFLERHVGFYETHPSAAFVGSNYNIIDASGLVLDRIHTFGVDAVWKGRTYIDRLLRSDYMPIAMQSVSFRASAIRERGFDEHVSPHFGDCVVLMRIAETADVGVLQSSLVEIRSHSEQTSTSLQPSKALSIRRELFDMYCAEYASRWPEQRALAATLLDHHHKSLRTAAVRSWFDAPSVDEGDACLALLRHDGGITDRILYTTLLGADRVLPQPLRLRLGKTIRRAKRSLRRLKRES